MKNSIEDKIEKILALKDMYLSPREINFLKEDDVLIIDIFYEDKNEHIAYNTNSLETITLPDSGQLITNNKDILIKFESDNKIKLSDNYLKTIFECNLAHNQTGHTFSDNLKYLLYEEFDDELKKNVSLYNTLKHENITLERGTDLTFGFVDNENIYSFESKYDDENPTQRNDSVITTNLSTNKQTKYSTELEIFNVGGFQEKDRFFCTALDKDYGYSLYTSWLNDVLPFPTNTFLTTGQMWGNSLSPNFRYAALWDNGMKIFDIANREELENFDFVGNPEVSWTSDSRKVVIGEQYARNKINIYDVLTKERKEVDYPSDFRLKNMPFTTINWSQLKE